MLIIDRFDGEWAIIEYDGQIFSLPRSLLPESAKEGDVVKLSVVIDYEATSERKKKAKSLLDGFFQ